MKIGSIKSNLGHTEPTSGLCSVAKLILSYETSLIMPNINFKTPRPDIEGLQNGQLVVSRIICLGGKINDVKTVNRANVVITCLSYSKVVTEPTPWNGGLTAVNSFGFGGANCHLVLDSNPKLKKNGGLPEDDLPRLVVTSGRTEHAVDTILTDVR